MPADTPKIFRIECEAYGAHVTLVDGLIDDCGRIVAQKKDAEGWFDVSTLKEPYRVEGKKTMGYELAEDFGWTLPDVVVYPTGGGTGLIGMWKAWDEMERLGWVGPARPRMVAVQAEGDHGQVAVARLPRHVAFVAEFDIPSQERARRLQVARIGIDDDDLGRRQ